MESFLDFNITSKITLDASISLMKYVAGVVLLVLISVIFMRLKLVYHDIKRKKFLNIWRPILMESIAHTPNKLPRLNKTYLQDFIAEWNSLYEKLGGISHDNLISIAARLDIHRHSAIMLISSHPRIQLTGIVTLGNMRVKSSWELLASIAQSDQTILSMAAYRALILIDGDRALEELLPILIKRSDWPASMIAKILKDTDNYKACELMTEACDNASKDNLPRILKYINALNCQNASKVFKRILTESHDDHLYSLCLQKLNDPSAIDIVREFTTYARWHVRVNAAIALGNIGAEEDIPVLEKMLSDPQWWVRYRAAQSLCKLPFIDTQRLNSIRSKHNDKFAKAILDQVLAEKELAS